MPTTGTARPPTGLTYVSRDEFLSQLAANYGIEEAQAAQAYNMIHQHLEAQGLQMGDEGSIPYADMIAGIDWYRNTYLPIASLGSGKPPAERTVPGGGAVSPNYTLETLRELIGATPELSALEYEQQLYYAPLFAQLATDLSREYLPQQYGLSTQLLGQYLPQYQEIATGARTQDRAADVLDVLNMAGLLPEVRAQAEGADVAGIRGVLTRQIADELAMGSKLTDEQRRTVEQGLRGSEIARGLGEGQGSANREAVAKALEGINLLNQRQTKASQFLTQEAAQRPDPFLAILGRPASAMSQGYGSMNQGLTQPASTGQVTSAYNWLSPMLSLYSTQGQLGLGAGQLALQNLQYQTGLDIAQQNPDLAGQFLGF